MKIKAEKDYHAWKKSFWKIIIINSNVFFFLIFWSFRYYFFRLHYQIMETRIVKHVEVVLWWDVPKYHQYQNEQALHQRHLVITPKIWVRIYKFQIIKISFQILFYYFIVELLRNNKKNEIFFFFFWNKNRNRKKKLDNKFRIVNIWIKVDKTEIHLYNYW